MTADRKTFTWFELISAGGVILSLIFVGLQVRENTKAVRSATVTALTDQSLLANELLITVPELREGYWKAAQGRADLTRAEQATLSTWMAMQLRIAENRYRQNQLGTLRGDLVAGGRSPALSLPFFRAYWSARREFHPADFGAFVDRELIPHVRDSLPSIILESK